MEHNASNDEQIITADHVDNSVQKKDKDVECDNEGMEESSDDGMRGQEELRKDL